MDFQLLIVRGRSAAEILRLADGVTTVGRQDECQIRIKSSQVSRRHCEFFEKKGLLLVKDLNSSNGTFVNGKKIDGQQILEPGDELTIGGVQLRVAKVGEAPPARVAAPAPAPGDTAVVEAISVSDGDDEEDFEIDFDDLEPEIAATAATEDSPAAAALAAAPAGAAPPKPAAAPPKPAAAPPKAAGPKPAAAHADPAAPLPDDADEAIADFLLDIKLDEDE